MKRIDVEQLRDLIRSSYNIPCEYIDYEQELMRDLERERITKYDFISTLESLYTELEYEYWQSLQEGGEYNV